MFDDVYNSTIYNLYFKEQRSKMSLISSDVAKNASRSVGLINKFENYNPIYEHPRFNELAPFYNVDVVNLETFRNQLGNLMNEFSQCVVYADYERIEVIYQQLLELLEGYDETILGSIFKVVGFVYRLLKSGHVDSNIISEIENIFDLITPKYQALYKLYLGQYYMSEKNFPLAKQAFDQSFVYISNVPNLLGMYHYCMASYMVRTGDVPNSIFHCENAISLFTKAQNYRRLINTNIIVGNQYLELKRYALALETFKNNLAVAKEQHLVHEERICLNNIAFIYMMKKDYETALDYAMQISDELIGEADCYARVICLGELEEYEKGMKFCLRGKSCAKTPYYKYIFRIYEKYFTDHDLKKLSKNLEKVFQRFDDYLDMFEKEMICILLTHQFKKINNTKKALEYYELLQEWHFLS